MEVNTWTPRGPPRRGMLLWQKSKSGKGHNQGLRADGQPALPCRTPRRPFC